VPTKPHPLIHRFCIPTLWVGVLAASLALTNQPPLASQKDQRQGRHGTLHRAQVPVASKAQLKRLGVTVVTESDGTSYGLVASIPEDRWKLVWPHLHKHGVDPFCVSDLGQSGLYVRVADFYKAQHLLVSIKPHLQRGLKVGEAQRVWIWNSPHP
jgi:hypothetical protein